jgi:ATP-dependent Zn protease
VSDSKAAVGTTSTRAFDQLASVSGDTVLNSRLADVGRHREQLRRRRLWRLAAVIAAPTVWVWYRFFDHNPIVFGLPEINWLLVTPILFFILLAVAMVVYIVVIGKSPHQVVRPEQIDVRLSDVVGIDVIKAEVVRSLNLFLSHKAFSQEMGGRPRRGLLFDGPPGTGKTYTAKAIAAEANVPFLFATATSFQSSFQGATQRKVRAYFRALRKLARKEGGAIGFIDEFDALAGARSGVTGFSPSTPLRSMQCGGLEGLSATSAGSIGPGSYGISAATQTTPFVGSGDLGMAVQELLVQLQSFDQPTSGEKFIGKIVDSFNLLMPAGHQLKKAAPKPSNIMLIASTNRPDSLDAALLRPGRFDQRLTFDRPDKAGRRALIDHFLTRKAHALELDDPERRDALAAVTQDYSPAMLEGLFDEALINAVQDSRRAMCWQDVEQARLDSEIGLGQPVRYTDHEAKTIATHEAGHATIAWLVAPERRLEVLSIIKRRSALGLLAHGDREDVYLRSRNQLLAMMQIAMGGQSAEEIFFGDVTTGPSGDLMTATAVAAQMVGAAGMTSTLVSYAAVQNSGFSDTNIVGRVLGDRAGRDAVEELLQEQKMKAKGLLESNRHLVEALRDALLERHELIGHEITDVLEAAAAAAATPSTIGAEPEVVAAPEVVASAPTVIDLRDADAVSDSPAVTIPGATGM